MARFSRRRSFGMRRRRSNYVWVRGTENDAVPVNPPGMIAHDMLDKYRTTAGITLNIPEFTIWRIRISISCKFTLNPDTFTENSGILHALFVEQADLTKVPFPVTEPYNEKYLMYDMYYAAEQIIQGATPVAAPAAANQFASYRVYDIKSHRRLGNLNDTLWVVTQPTGNVSGMTTSWTYSILLRQK